jgi:hypothetical protein
MIVAQKKSSKINIDFSAFIGDSRLTFIEMIMIIVTFFLKTKASIQQIEFILSLITLLCPSNNQDFPANWYNFFQNNQGKHTRTSTSCNVPKIMHQSKSRIEHW